MQDKATGTCIPHITGKSREINIIRIREKLQETSRNLMISSTRKMKWLVY